MSIQKIEIVSGLPTFPFVPIPYFNFMFEIIWFEFFRETAVASSFVSAEAKRRKSSLSQDSAEKQLAKVTEEDLTTEGEPSDGYWKVVAEKRRIALDISLKENEELHEKVASLEEELGIARAMLDESKNLVEVLTEMIQDPGNDSGLPNSVYGECSQSINTDDDSITDDTEDEIGHESTVIEKDIDAENQGQEEANV